MLATKDEVSLEEQIDQWRSYLRRRQAIHAVDVVELEDHLREQIAVLVDAGLTSRRLALAAFKTAPVPTLPNRLVTSWGAFLRSGTL